MVRHPEILQLKFQDICLDWAQNQYILSYKEPFTHCQFIFKVSIVCANAVVCLAQ